MKCRYRIRSYDYAPPGSWTYWQTQGISRQFGPDPSVENLARVVASFRAGNGLLRATVKEALFDIGCYTCFRINNDPSFCNAVEEGFTEVVGFNETSPVVAAPCAGCGAPIT
jgi:hypothetical protein